MHRSSHRSRAWYHQHKLQSLLPNLLSKDEVAQPVAEKSTVTFSVAAPELATRAEHGDGTLAKNLTYAVYNRADGAKLFDGTATMDAELKATVEIPFVNGMTYDVLFWAESENSPYLVNWTAKTVGYNPAVTLVSNSKDYDAFYAYVNDIPEITGPVTKTVELKRPFAQLNIKTNDAAKAAQSGVVVEEVKVVVKKGYSSFDLVDGTGEDQGDVTFGFATTETTTDLLAVNYLFTGGEKSLVDVEFTYTDENNNVSAEGRTMEFASVPVQRNYRTNIVGSLLTSDGTFNVEIKKGFETTEHNVDVVTVASAQDLADAFDALNDDDDTNDPDQIILTGDIDLNDLLGTRAAEPTAALTIEAGKKVTLDLGGFKLSYEKKPTSTFSMIENKGTLVISNGTLDYTDTNTLTADVNYSSSTIRNAGTLTLENVTVLNNSNETVGDYGYPHCVDNFGTLTINSGTLTNNSKYSTVRIWCTEAGLSNVTINGGTFNGAIDFHNVSAKPNKGILTINGGTFNATPGTPNAIRLLDFGNDVDEMVATINGGTFNGAIVCRNYAGGTSNSQVFFVKGGTFCDASVFEFLADGAEVELGADIETSNTITLAKSVKINGNNKTITSTADRLFNIDVDNINVVINDLDMFAAYERTGTNDVRGINILRNHSGINLTINNSTIRFKAPYGCDWAYAVNQMNGNTGNSITVNGGEFEGANVFNLWGAGNNTYNIDGAKITSLYPTHDRYYGYGIIVWSNSSTNINNTVSIKNCSFDGINAEAISVYDHENTLTLENNVDNCSIDIVYTADNEYTTLDKALEKGVDFELIANTTYNKTITIGTGKEITLDLNGKTLSGTCNAGQGHLIMVENGATLTVEDSSANADGKITFAQGTSNVGWVIDLEGELNLYSGTIELTGSSWSIGYAVDVRPNAWGTAYKTPTTFNMYGGKLISSDGAIRVASSSYDNYSEVSANFNMMGGEIQAAYDGIFIQQSNVTYDNLNVNISGGKIKSDAYPVRLYGPVATGKVSTADVVEKINITGGEIVPCKAEGKTALLEDLIYIAGGATAETLYFTEINVEGEGLPTYNFAAKAL